MSYCASTQWVVMCRRGTQELFSAGGDRIVGYRISVTGDAPGGNNNNNQHNNNQSAASAGGDNNNNDQQQGGGNTNRSTRAGAGTTAIDVCA